MAGGRATMTICYEPPPTYFVHVPKTGGISLGTFLEANFRHADYVRLNPPRLAQLAPADLKHFRCYHAMHQGRTLLEMTGRTDLTCITVVRDPVERSVSQLLYLQRTIAKIPETFTAAYVAQVAPIMHAELSECLGHEAFLQACNSQIRTLGILEDYTPFFKGSVDAASGRTVLRPYDPPPLMDTSDRNLLLDNARRWLNEMAVVGMTEYYAESLLLVCDALGIPPPANLPRHNVNPQRSDLTSRYRTQLAPEVVGQIEALTAHDQQLYGHAHELFMQQWTRYQAHPQRTYSIAPRLRQGAVRLNRPIKRVKRTFKRLLQSVQP